MIRSLCIRIGTRNWSSIRVSRWRRWDVNAAGLFCGFGGFRGGDVRLWYTVAGLRLVMVLKGVYVSELCGPAADGEDFVASPRSALLRWTGGLPRKPGADLFEYATSFPLTAHRGAHFSA